MEIAGVNSATASAVLSQTRANNTGADVTSATSTRARLASDIRRDLGELERFREVLRGFRFDLQTVRRGRNGVRLGTISSESTLGLRNTTTSASIQSSAEINASTTGFSPAHPLYAGSTTALPTIGGTYNGSTDETLTFTNTQPGQTSSNKDKTIEITDSSGTLLETLIVPGGYVAGTELSLTNGLRVSFTDGFLSNGDSFALSVFANVENSVNADNPYNGSGATDPNFESGVSVTAGSFTVNGETINVAADDTINTVLAAITNSAAGVSATFNSSTERVVLTSTTAGASGTITFGADSSGFLAAVKLDTATLTPGTDSEFTSPMSNVAKLQSVQSGAFSINQTSVGQDPSIDSLEDVLSRINGATTNVTFSYSTGTDLVTLTPNGTSGVQLADNGTNFFSAINITSGQRSFQTGNSRSVAVRAVVERVADFAQAINRLVDRSSHSAELAATLSDTITRAVREANDLRSDREASKVLKDLGITLDSADTKNFFSIDEGKLASAIRRGGKTFFEVFLRNTGLHTSEGIVPNLEEVVSTERRLLEDALPVRGRVVDVFA